MYVIGIDPGPLPGVVRLLIDEGHGTLTDTQALQVTPDLIEPVLDLLLAKDDRVVVAVERFVAGPRSSRSSTPAAGAATRDMIVEITRWTTAVGSPVHSRSAAEVKPWASDSRLDAVGLLELTKGMRHARDAARHALYCAVKDYGLPDPLSRRGRAV